MTDPAALPRGTVPPTAPPTAPRVALVGGHWAQNVGNAFFNLGGAFVLGEVFGRDAVGFFMDQPNYRTLHDKFKGNPETYVDFIQHLDIDYLVLQGPVLNAWLGRSWERTFRVLREKGTRVIFLSAAFFKFHDSEIKAVREVLEACPPALISTRDHHTYEILEDWVPGVPKYSGIDSGFFLDRCVTPFGTRPGTRHVIHNFDRYPEPELLRRDPGGRYNTRQVEIEGETYFVSVPRWLDKQAHKGKIRSYFGDLFDRRKLPATFDGRMIVRPEHRFFPHVTHKIYRQPGAMASDEPWSYITLYANADFTLSDRVHACVATLAFGSPAMLFTPSPRAALFDRLGLGGIRSGLVGLDPDHLREEQDRQVAWLKETVRAG